MLRRLPYFAYLLEGGMEEAFPLNGRVGGGFAHRFMLPPAVVKMPRLDGPTLRRVIHFAYTDDAEGATANLSDTEAAMALVAAANELDLLRLRDAAERQLQELLVFNIETSELLRPGTAVQILRFAARQGLKRLRRKVLVYMKEHFGEVGMEPGFVAMANEESELYREVVQFVAGGETGGVGLGALAA